MLFNSYSFVFFYLPLVLIIFGIIQNRFRNEYIIAYLFITSLIFYGLWNQQYLPILLISILFNYTISLLIKQNYKQFYYLGLLGNLSLLIYFKYSQFVINNFSILLNQPIELINGDLPLGISFFTFTQIAYLTDCYKNQIKAPTFINYGLFVTFFPHLMAGPILHHQEIMPQFKPEKARLLTWNNTAIGIAIFSIGLFKKSIIADTLAPYANQMFDAASHGPVTFIEAWSGSICYTFQLYFDFSGYSDMAIGLARMFGIIFPLNFNSPYKAKNIISFWRRWHMTLSRFLRDYIYIPLGGNRHGKMSKYVNLMITMFVGGIWHGAAWTFIVWGLLHGLFLVINHLWLYVKQKYLNFLFSRTIFIYKAIAQTITFIIVVVAWVFFRAETFSTSYYILNAMFNPNPSFTSTIFAPEQFKIMIELLLISSLLIFVAPNTQQLFYKFKPALETYPGEIEPYSLKMLQWSPNALTAAVCAILTVISLLSFGKVSEFLYYKF
ncbi:MBOAT family O-acyltransferase [Legionella bononiensis]|uniref:Probable alginate O-acetylase n=1 Tax=Legionella bononiensis TaxID=2793102 RepID=A0ABS1W7Z1_9GAMM|nr:MBOAT family O-acyltransferase [Legionella bononiensis]MBL7480027.1 MBOAT family protein [Legionella bononiensis]MBL7525459.1 MBOAT family protein [Legionella bononiensis]MBL7561642.1 MBOAT family protein [Legionella bononiensis]